MTFPKLNRSHAFVFPDLKAVPAEVALAPATGVVLINSNTVGRDLEDFGVLVVQSTAAITLAEVMGPAGWGPYPGLPATTDAANKILIIRGRWPQVRVTTAGNVSVRGDMLALAYGSM